MQYFIALTFDETDPYYQKIDHFQQRFDTKYNRSPYILLTLMSPFRVTGQSWSVQTYQELVECLREDVDNFLMGMPEPLYVEFNGFDFAAGKKGVVYLKPELPSELFFFAEAAKSFLQECGATFNRDKKGPKTKNINDHTFLPIGRSDHQGLLQRAVETARAEFQKPFKLSAHEIVLFEKLPGQWIKRDVLYSFKMPEKEERQSEHFSSLTNLGLRDRILS